MPCEIEAFVRGGIFCLVESAESGDQLLDPGLVHDRVYLDVLLVAKLDQLTESFGQGDCDITQVDIGIDKF